MMKHLLIFIVCVFVYSSASVAQIAEIKLKATTVAAPRECVAAFREFFGYLQKKDTNIVKDQQAQERWLTLELRMALKGKVATFTNPQDDPDFPGNGTFIGSWDYPSMYAIVASRRYGKRAIIDVLYQWGPRSNYPGDERTTSFIFLLEDGKWKLDDIYTFRGRFVQAESLNQYFREK